MSAPLDLTTRYMEAGPGQEIWVTRLPAACLHMCVRHGQASASVILPVAALARLFDGLLPAGAA